LPGPIAPAQRTIRPPRRAPRRPLPLRAPCFRSTTSLGGDARSVSDCAEGRSRRRSRSTTGRFQPTSRRRRARLTAQRPANSGPGHLFSPARGERAGRSSASGTLLDSSSRGSRRGNLFKGVLRNSKAGGSAPCCQLLVSAPVCRPSAVGCGLGKRARSREGRPLVSGGSTGVSDLHGRAAGGSPCHRPGRV
jgi:hypothetical protein